MLWKGECTLTGATELLQRLALAGKVMVFLSTNSQGTKPELALSFTHLSFTGPRLEQFFSSVLCAAHLLRQSLSGPPNALDIVFVLGGEGLLSQLSVVDCAWLGTLQQLASACLAHRL